MDLSGQVIRGYELQELIGAGGFGAVYRAFQTAVQREVAIKVILQRYTNQPEFIRRFEAEAQLVARLEHAHIVPLYDFWRDPEGAYLVMRWLRGGSLRDQLKQGALSLDATARILDQMAGALMTAHRRSIVHRDLKPDNILMDEAQDAYLADFGISKDTTQPPDSSEVGVVTGSPSYLAPEQIRGDLLTPQVDIYSMGIVLYEMLAGQRPFPSSTFVELLQKHLFEPVPSITQRRPDLPSEIDHVIQKATAKSAEQRFPDILSMATAFRRAIHPDLPHRVAEDGLPLETRQPGEITTRPVTLPLVGGLEEPTAVLSAESQSGAADALDQTLRGLLVVENPYKGLRAFQEADAEDFFGRDALIQQLLARLRQGGESSRFLTVIGPSGSGKSSAVKAGLIPAIRQGGLPGSERWFVVEMTPGLSPMSELAEALRRVAIHPPDDMEILLREQNNGLVDLLGQTLPDGTDLLLAIDQFEEAFTLCADTNERRQFLDSLFAAATQPESRLHLVLTLRADYYDRPLMYPDFGGLLRQHTEVVLPLTKQEIESAVRGPAERIGQKLETGLVDAIIADVSDQPGALPLLQYALTELFERRAGNLLKLEAYRSSGGVFGALARRADDLFQSFDQNQQALTRQIFLRLVALGDGTEDTRRRIQRTELSAFDDQREILEPILDEFGRYRLLTFDRDPISRTPTLEIAHEALIRTWDRLRGWLNESREDLVFARRLTAATADWIKSERDNSFLASGSRLEQFEQWAAATDLRLNEEEAAFLKTSVEEREFRRKADEARKAHAEMLERRAENIRRVLMVVLLFSTIGASILSVLAFNAQRLAELNERMAILAKGEAVNNSQTAVANAIQSESLRLAAEANNVMQTGGNVDLAALLSIRAVNLRYSPEADTALLRAAAQTFSQRVFLGHTDTVSSAAFAADGKQILTASWDSTARLWDAQTGKEIRQFKGHTKQLYRAVFAPDGKRILTASYDGTARLWDVESGQSLREFKVLLEGSPDPIPVTNATFSPDGKRIATSTTNGQVVIWDVDSASPLGILQGHMLRSNSAVFAPDGKRLLTSSDDRTVRVWDVATGKQLLQLDGHTDLVYSAVFSPDGTRIASGSFDRTARVWDAATGKLLITLAGHINSVVNVVFAPDGKSLLSASYDGTARLWEWQSGTTLKAFTGHTDWVFGLAFSADGKQILTGSRDRTLRLWDATPAKPNWFIGHTNIVTSARFSPDGKQVLTASYDGTARLWDRQTGAELRKLSGHTDTVYDAAFSPDGKIILTGGQDAVIKVWDAASGREIAAWTGHTDRIFSLSFAPDGKRAISASRDKTVILWDVASGESLMTFQGHATGVFGGAFSPDGKRIVTGGEDGSVRLWEVESGKELRQFSPPDNTTLIAAYGVAFSPDGKKVVAGFSTLNVAQLWDAETGQPLLSFKGHSDGVYSMAFSRDGKTLATGSWDGTARLWSVETGAELRRLPGDGGLVYGVSFAADGKWLLTAHRSGVARQWETSYLDTVQNLCARLVRDLTEDERVRLRINDTQPTCGKR